VDAGQWLPWLMTRKSASFKAMYRKEHHGQGGKIESVPHRNVRSAGVRRRGGRNKRRTLFLNE
jgi:hypothetical protein